MAKKQINIKSWGLFGSIFLFVLTVFVFYYFWLQTQVEATIDYSIDPKYQAVEIDSVKSDAEALINNRSNLSEMPINAPSDELIGREDPFVSL